MTLHPALAALPWAFVAAPNGIVQNPQGAVALGAVLLIQRQDGQVVFARKAPRPGYAFSRLLVLPGGLCRTDWPARALSVQSLEQTIARSLRGRALLECGWSDTSAPLTPITISWPVITSYVVNGQNKYTAVCLLPRNSTRGPATPQS